MRRPLNGRRSLAADGLACSTCRRATAAVKSGEPLIEALDPSADRASLRQPTGGNLCEASAASELTRSAPTGRDSQGSLRIAHEQLTTDCAIA